MTKRSFSKTLMKLILSNDLLMADDVQAQINELTGVVNEIIMGGE